MMGVRFDPIFLLTFVIGALFLGLFAARRFDDRTAPAGEGRFRVLSNLEPGDMGGTAPAGGRREAQLHGGQRGRDCPPAERRLWQQVRPARPCVGPLRKQIWLYR